MYKRLLWIIVFLFTTLTLTQSAGVYQSKSRAAYWDGKNQVGEPVASGVYFCSLTAGDFTVTRNLLMLNFGILSGLLRD